MASSSSRFELLGVLVIILWTSAHAARRYPHFPDDIQLDRLPLQTQRPFNIAHRGSNGEIPEETVEAYLRAIAEGADFIESDITATKDGKLICFHDLILDDVTDVASHAEFANRIQTYEVEGETVTGYFSVDFTLAEIKTLRARQRFPFRDQSFNDKFQVATFEEFIAIALNAERVVGIYPEIKSPVFVNKHVKWPNSKTHEDIFVETLLKFGYGGKYLSDKWKEKPLFIQSFAPTSLIRTSKLIDSPLILLLDNATSVTQDTKQTYAEITSDAYLKFISDYVEGLGPWKDTVVPPDVNNYLAAPTDLVTRAHALSLQVHPYTYRNENKYLHFDFHQDPYQEYRYWIHNVSVDGLFTDFVGTMHLYQQWTSPLH
jgi:glycerophosphoryl diester phosphodiesterase